MQVSPKTRGGGEDLDFGGRDVTNVAVVVSTSIRFDSPSTLLSKHAYMHAAPNSPTAMGRDLMRWCEKQGGGGEGMTRLRGKDE